MGYALVGFTLLAVCGRASANPVDAFGFGSRAPALGGAVTADVDDVSANYYNPAGLVRGHDLRLDVGYRYAKPLLKLNGYDSNVDASSGFALGIVAPGRIGPFRFAFGVSLWLPDVQLNRLRSLPPDQPRFVYYDNRMQRLVLSTNLAIQIVPGLYVGVGLTFMSKTQGTVNLQGSVGLGDSSTSSLVTDISVDLVAVRYPQAGILWQATRRLSLGLTYRHKFQLDVQQSFRIDGSIGNPGVDPIVPKGFFAAVTRSTDMFQPWQLTLGGALKITPRLEVLVDVTYARWSEFPGATPGLDLSADVGQFNSKLKLPKTRIAEQPRFHDIVIPRVGVEWRALDGDKVGVLARFGYSYEPTAAPEQIGNSSLADADKHTFSIGCGIELRRLQPILPRPMTFDLHLAVTGLPDRANEKLQPTNRAGDFIAGGVAVSAGASIGVRF